MPERVYTHSAQTERAWVRNTYADQLRVARDEARRDLRFDLVRLIDAELRYRGLEAAAARTNKERA